ncbi:DUF6415 family natural product biosynthesis protein [Streptomyces sp. NPDC047028]|uniref:DUF6415 family natural product biosynthesis protein n=1 Tax=Streptomyces sp. NPDC047028 TaxID=3155793 RepID=UPI0033CCA617
MNIPRKSDPELLPADIATMRETADMLLGPDITPTAAPPPPEELDTITVMLRGHLELLIAEASAAIGYLPETGVLRNCAVACIGEARRKLATGPSRRDGGPMAHARRLARVLRALCDHYENAGAAVVPWR